MTVTSVSALRFDGQWRPYQQRVLDRFALYAQDRMIHVVAAPGSGKTTLGIELFRRVGAPVLVLVPTVTIREQWVARIVGAFLPKGTDVSALVSQDLGSPRPITIATYQALFMAAQKSGSIGDLVALFKGHGLGTLCLDECHHLKSEWWRALEDFKTQMGDVFSIALTATPPYDSTAAQWRRYCAMCGEVDEEIAVPELVKSGALCPHQDYAYLLGPDKDKAGGVCDIVLSEAATMGRSLRLLVLTDYIKNEYLPALGAGEYVDDMGVVPLFDRLRQEVLLRGEGVSLAALSGSTVIIPAGAQDSFVQAAGTDDVKFAPAGTLDDYVLVRLSSGSQRMVQVMTKLFEQGSFNVLVGTKSLLGEGWDSPCINALVLASFVGSYVLSNQMRGRAIRSFAQEPNKTSNIWHLVSLSPGQQTEANGTEGENDLDLMARRFDHFVGLHYDEDVIESGLTRLSLLYQKGEDGELELSVTDPEAINSGMLRLAGERARLRQRWERALVVSEEMVVLTGVPTKEVPKAFLRNALARLVVSVLATGATAVLVLAAVRWLGLTRMANTVIRLGLAALFVAMSSRPFERFLGALTPQGRLKDLGRGVKDALWTTGQLQEDATVCVSAGVERQSVYLQGGTGRDKELFATCMRQMFDVPDSPRCLLRIKGFLGRPDYLVVPDCLAQNKERSQSLVRAIRRRGIVAEALYTRSAAGQEELELARRTSFAARNKRIVSRQRFL